MLDLVPLGVALYVSRTPSARDVERALGKPVRVVRQQFVRLGESRGDFVALLDGVTAGQELVTAGAFKLRNGASVVVSDEVKLTPQVAPRPENR